MKKNFLLLSMLVSLLALNTSCHKEYVTEEYYQGAQVYTLEYTIQPNEWQLDDNGERPYLYVIVDNRDITDAVMKNGAVLGYMWNTYNQEENLSSWNTLPYVYPYVYQTDEGSTAVGENIRFEYEPGTVTFVIEDLDAVTPGPVLDPMTFKIVVVKNM
jgi:hypothetical protein